MALDYLVRLGRDLSTLAVFRALNSDPVIGGMQQHLLACDEGGDMSAYVQAVGDLYASGAPSLARYICDAVLEDENPYLLARAANDLITPSLEASLTRELAVLQRLANMTPADLAGDVLGEGALWDPASVPGFEVEEIPLVNAYQERIASIGTQGYGIYARFHAFKLDECAHMVPVAHPDPICLDDLVDYERERGMIIDNTKALLQGMPAANMLLTGDAGTGKSSSIKAVANEYATQGLRILEVRKEQLFEIPDLLDTLSRNPLKFIIFIDDLSFSTNDDNFTALKAILEGSVAAKSDNVVIYATSNRRHLVRERMTDREGDDVHRNDTMQEIISLSDRFGLRISFYKPNKQSYLHIVHKLAEQAGIAVEPEILDLEAERFATRRGGRSARGARQFVDSLRAKRAQL